VGVLERKRTSFTEAFRKSGGKTYEVRRSEKKEKGVTLIDIARGKSGVVCLVSLKN